jgi:hypothetical protein
MRVILLFAIIFIWSCGQSEETKELNQEIKSATDKKDSTEKFYNNVIKLMDAGMDENEATRAVKNQDSITYEMLKSL